MDPKFPASARTPVRHHPRSRPLPLGQSGTRPATETAPPVAFLLHMPSVGSLESDGLQARPALSPSPAPFSGWPPLDWPFSPLRPTKLCAKATSVLPATFSPPIAASRSQLLLASSALKLRIPASVYHYPLDYSPPIDQTCS